jgi:hypothetical protein
VHGQRTQQPGLHRVECLIGHREGGTDPLVGVGNVQQRGVGLPHGQQQFARLLEPQPCGHRLYGQRQMTARPADLPQHRVARLLGGQARAAHEELYGLVRGQDVELGQRDPVRVVQRDPTGDQNQ